MKAFCFIERAVISLFAGKRWPIHQGLIKKNVNIHESKTFMTFESFKGLFLLKSFRKFALVIRFQHIVFEGAKNIQV